MTKLASGPPNRAIRVLVLVGVCLLAYYPALDNGFIADDYVFLERAPGLLSDPWLLFRIPPEHFRSFTYLEFLLVKTTFGFWAAPFYAASIALHFINCLLVERLVSKLKGPSVGWLAALIFACFQNPQEAVMWLGGSHELPALGFMLAGLITWLSPHWKWTFVFWVCAFFSKETAVLMPAMLLLVDLWKGRPWCWKRYLWIASASPIFAAVILWQWSSNSLIEGQYYALQSGAAGVLIRSLWRLLFPWGAIVVAVAISRRAPGWRAYLAPFAWILLTLLPYIFLTYQDHVPSRHEYLAAFGFAALLGQSLAAMPPRWCWALVAAFVVGNAGYIHLRKDAQFEIRAAPTRRLIDYMKAQPPHPVAVQNLPFNGWIAKLTTRTVDSWTPDMIHTVDTGDGCSGCPILRWNPVRLEFELEGRGAGRK